MARLDKGDGSFPPTEGVRISNAALVAGIGAIAVVVFVVLTVTSGITHIEPGKIGVLVNNVTGTIDTIKEPGMVTHLPLGLTDVHIMDRTLQTFEMSGSQDTKAQRDNPRLKIKSRDGSDVYIDVNVTYAIDPTIGDQIARQVGVDPEEIREILVAYTRSVLRDELGRLSIDDVINADTRNESVGESKKSVEENARLFGIDINTIAAQNPNFNPDYERLISERKRADQDFTNQKSAQERARSNQRLQAAEATRLREIAVREEEGKQARRIIEAQAEAQQLTRRAEGEAYSLKVEGERQRDIGLAEAEAIRAEGLSRAEGIRKLAEAYARGGLGMVREALAGKYRGARIQGRPYTLDDTISRMRIEETESAAAARTAGSN